MLQKQNPEVTRARVEVRGASFSDVHGPVRDDGQDFAAQVNVNRRGSCGLVGRATSSAGVWGGGSKLGPSSLKCDFNRRPKTLDPHNYQPAANWHIASHDGSTRNTTSSATARPLMVSTLVSDHLTNRFPARPVPLHSPECHRCLLLEILSTEASPAREQDPGPEILEAAVAD